MILLAIIFTIRRAELFVLEHQNFQDLTLFNRETLDEDLSFKEAILEALPDAVLVTDYSSILHANKAIENITGYTSNELLGEKPSVFKSGNTHFEVYDDIKFTIGKR